MACEVVRNSDDIGADVVLAIAAFGRADLDAFNQATSDLDTALPCMGETIDAPMAASVHRVEGIRAFVDKDDAKLIAAFGAARAMEPAWEFPSSLVKPGHPLRERYDAALPTEIPIESVPYVAGGYLTIDGQQSWERHTSLATLVQRFDGEGKVLETRYVWPAEPWLTYDVGRPASQRVEWSPQRKRLFASSLGTGLVAAGMYGLAYTWADKYRSSNGDVDSNVPHANGDAWRTRTNTLVMASAATGALAIGLGGASVVVTGTW